MKKCTKCEELKSTSEFYKRSASSDGLMFKCKSCNYFHGKDWRENNRDKTLVRQRKWEDSLRENIVYAIVTESGLYIGSSSMGLHRRLKVHKADILKGRANPNLIKAYITGGWESFDCFVIEKVLDKNKLKIREQFHMDLYSELLNINPAVY